MAFNKDKSGIDNTCPKIDHAIGIAEAFFLTIENNKPLAGELQEFRRLMENIRSANEDLREWGNTECDRADDLEKEVDSLKDRIGYLESDNDDLSVEVSSLSEELEKLA